MKTATFLSLMITLLVGCSSSAQMVRKDATGGRIALQGAFMPAMSEAHLLMAEHCHGRFEATEQGEAVEFRCRRALPSAEPIQVAARASSRGEL